ncbi:alkaline phosphatase family protein [Flavisolibacter ginsengisoli]|uniref:Phosphoglycerate mutase n=1 Tax=Flavisolibacter ginsengisoli DSM 18119 TaxID=1121884 RepID=A0A1M5E904_9BACT|nr:alkaline phosphatase family protein [Flavisolibacter ginsengisoli]SHF75719.1 phosphoglycerate mutase [Flavisolibacter ginsengisoli DSM 18119]
MKALLICMVLITLSVSVSNTQRSMTPLDPQNKLFIITLDGFRWQELFNGADSALLNDKETTPLNSTIKALYWDRDPIERRKKLMPFTWNVIAKDGQLYGNRKFQNKVNVSNPYALSYPGYSELLTGSVDLTINSNSKTKNTNSNILELLNGSPAYKGKVAAFTSWDVFPYILNEQKSSFVINSGFENVKSKEPSIAQKLLNTLQSDVIAEKTATRYDELTYIASKEYIQNNKPSVVFLSFSGTDNAGHENRYDQYLEQANNADRMIGELWRMVQSMPEYAGKTTFMITTDHGRGNLPSNWGRHGLFVPGSGQTWFALLGHNVVPSGEMKTENQVYQKSLKDLMTQLLTRK